jgi:DNA-binding transcriptional LysR family regulator
MFTVKQLGHAIALDRYRNFHRAAEAVGISQPAFSRSIRVLENELEVRLFDRQGAGVTPTIYGEALLRRAETMFGETKELLQEISLLKGLGAGKLEVAAGVYPAELSAAPAIGALHEQHPNLYCRLQLTSWRKIAELVTARQVDLGVAEISTLHTINELQVDPVGNHEFVFFTRHGHPLDGKKALTKADLDDYAVVTVRLPPRVATVFPGRTRTDKQSGELIPTIEVDDLTGARHIIATSNAFGMATPLQIEPWPKSGEIKALPFHAPWMRFDYGFIYLRQRMLSPAAALYMELVKRIEKDVARRNRSLMRQITSEG